MKPAKCQAARLRFMNHVSAPKITKESGLQQEIGGRQGFETRQLDLEIGEHGAQ